MVGSSTETIFAFLHLAASRYVEERVLSDSLAARNVDFDLGVRGDESAVQDLAATLALLLGVRGKFLELEKQRGGGDEVIHLAYRVAAAGEAVCRSAGLFQLLPNPAHSRPQTRLKPRGSS
jgi:hypothetical protein